MNPVLETNIAWNIQTQSWVMRCPQCVGRHPWSRKLAGYATPQRRAQWAETSGRALIGHRARQHGA